MAIKNRCIVATKWKVVNGRNQPEAIDDAPSGVSITDMVGQDDTIIPPTPNIYLAEVDGLSNAQLTALKGITKYVVLMEQQYDDATIPATLISSNYDDQPTGPQLSNLKSIIQTRFPDVDDDKITEAGQGILRAGLTRREILQLLINRWQRFAKG